MKMLSDLLIGHNWPIIGRFCQINQKKSTGLYPNVLYSFHGYQKNRIDPNTSEKKVWLNQIFASRVIVVLGFLHTENRRKIIIQ